MKRFRCRCGQPAFFENQQCGACGLVLGFDPRRIDVVALVPSGDDQLRDDDGAHYRHCRNRIEHGNCNWLVGAADRGELCLACATSAVIPNLGMHDNVKLWGRLEQAKRRLFYSLLSLGLPTERDEQSRPLRFVFLEDQSRNPHVVESYVATGHHDGTITINIAEADDSARHAIRESMQESYRTLLGHFRHEAGHYYFDYLVDHAGDAEFSALFGDWRQDYAAALESYYAVGRDTAGNSGFISAYAAAHPLEDWAEIFAHYLHITETLETAAWALPEEGKPVDWLSRWMHVSLRLNELNRSLGAPQPYPFVLSNDSIAKLRFMDRRVRLRVASAA